MRLVQARAAVEALERDLAIAHYEQLSGLKPDVDTGRLYARHPGLFEKDTVAAALDAAKAPGAGNAERFLAEHLAHGYLDARVQPLSDEADRIEGTLMVPVQGTPVPYRMLPVLIGNEPHRERRHDLTIVRDHAMDKHLNPVLKQRLERMHTLARDLGLADYAALCSTTKGVDIAKLRDDLEPLVRRTESLYRWHMEGLLGRGASIMLTMADKHDVAYTLRAPWFDDQFPRGKSVEEFERVAGAMGLTLHMPNILLDVEERPAKTSRAFVVGVRVPEDVRLVVQPKGGQDDYRSLFHEAGHALHFGLAAKGLPMEYRVLGDNSVTEAFAFVLEHILSEEAWAKPRIAPLLFERYLWQQRVVHLFMVRRYVAKLRYELELHTKGLADGPDTYQKVLNRVLVFHNPREHWLADLDDGFYAANYLRAWALESILRGHLKERFGATWWETRAAGDFLRGLWAKGQSLTPEQLCEGLGTKFSMQPLIEEMVNGLKQEPRDFQQLPKF